ncbi:SDR family oxidoreductase [Patescibacteria group bacterium]|nr:SDR family oxidoreductase [Patescibacteria group bacterium]
MKPAALIIGGTSGLGLEISRRLTEYSVYVTGRKKVEEPAVHRIELELNCGQMLPSELDRVVNQLPPLGLLVYAAGFYQAKTVAQLTDADISQMLNIGLRAPVMLLQRILMKQKTLPGFIAITSSSAWTPRKDEPLYCATKAGLSMLADALAEDPACGKVLQVAPGGMKTPFWDGTDKDTSDMLDPSWVAGEVQREFEGDFSYKYIRIFRSPARTEIEEVR